MTEESSTSEYETNYERLFPSNPPRFLFQLRELFHSLKQEPEILSVSKRNSPTSASSRNHKCTFLISEMTHAQRIFSTIDSCWEHKAKMFTFNCQSEKLASLCRFNQTCPMVVPVEWIWSYANFYWFSGTICLTWIDAGCILFSASKFHDASGKHAVLKTQSKSLITFLIEMWSSPCCQMLCLLVAEPSGRGNYKLGYPAHRLCDF